MKNLYSSITFSFSLLTLLLGIYIVFYANGNSQLKQNSVLYISNADVNATAKNLQVYQISDSSLLVSKLDIDNAARDGNGILVAASKNILFQISRARKSILVYTHAHSLTNSTQPTRTITDSTLSSGRDIAYDSQNDVLFVSNNIDSSIRIYDKVSTLKGRYVGKKIKMSAEPWGIVFDTLKNRLLVVMEKNALRVEVFNNPSALLAIKNTPDLKFYINGFKTNGVSSCLHGIAYSSLRDMLFITEIGKTTGTNSDSDGGIYIIDRVSKITNNSSILPHRAIYGNKTNLGDPMDIVIDDRSTKGFIYVAEKANKKVLVFGFGDNGNTTPIREYSSPYSPEGIDITY